jgi:hypothetical protein
MDIESKDNAVRKVVQQLNMELHHAIARDPQGAGCAIFYDVSWKPENERTPSELSRDAGQPFENLGTSTPAAQREKECPDADLSDTPDPFPGEIQASVAARWEHFCACPSIVSEVTQKDGKFFMSFCSECSTYRPRGMAKKPTLSTRGAFMKLGQISKQQVDDIKSAAGTGDRAAIDSLNKRLHDLVKADKGKAMAIFEEITQYPKLSGGEANDSAARTPADSATPARGRQDAEVSSETDDS